MTQLQRLAIAPSQLQDQQILLTTQQQHYLGRVLRLREGSRFIAIDGQGQWWLAVLKGVQAQILEPIPMQTELPVSITLMLALPKGNGFDEVVRYCTELGVTCIAPVVSDRTLLNPSPQKLQRWQRIAKEAAEQSERSFVPAILEPVPFTTSLAASTATHRYFCVARSNCPHLKGAITQVSTTAEILIAIGPEGGWTVSEIESAIAVGFQPVSLGRRILRAVTAPIVALSIVAAAFEPLPESVQGADSYV
jgi:16S rRNA (uracil1498-N3)-methyltransferase